MKANYHTHSTWCDGADTPQEMIRAAVEKGFRVLGFSSHAMLPEEDTDWVLTPAKAVAYVREIRALAAERADRLTVCCGAEADYVPGGAVPERAVYAHLGLDYLIGSIHFVVAPDGARVPVDHTPELLRDGIRDHFGGSVEAYVRAYFAQERDMVARYDFDVLGHPDLVRKFNVREPWFDEEAAWYRDEVAATAEAIAASGKIVEVNTGAIARGWLNDAYPAQPFRDLLRARGVAFILSSDAHAAAALDGSFDRFGAAEDYVDLMEELGRRRAGEKKGM